MCSSNVPSDSPLQDIESNPPVGQRRLWTPWRMKYVGGDSPEQGCIFCDRLAAVNDVASLLLYRGRHAFMIMNLFPYNTGHVMVVPNRHLADLEELTVDELSEMSRLVVLATRALRRALGPAGFNLGMNVGAIAGAGVADHLHQHIVPRWQGDANFMPILAGTVVMPELIPATYAKIRSELERPEMGRIPLVIFSASAEQVLMLEPNTLPSIDPDLSEPIVKTAIRHAQFLDSSAGLIGWAGQTRADETGQIGLAFLAPSPLEAQTGGKWIEPRRAADLLSDPDDRVVLANALNLDLFVAPGPPN